MNNSTRCREDRNQSSPYFRQYALPEQGFCFLSSCGTGPKTLLPFGWPSLSIITTALSSNLTSIPSERPRCIAACTTTLRTTLSFFTFPFGIASFTDAIMVSTNLAPSPSKAVCTSPFLPWGYPQPWEQSSSVWKSFVAVKVQQDIQDMIRKRNNREDVTNPSNNW